MVRDFFVLSSVTKSFDENNILHAISLSFSHGTSYAIIGESGSGKTTLLHMLSGLEKPTTGALYCDGVDMYMLKEQERAALVHKHIGLVFQSPYLMAELTVLENVMVKGIIEGQSKASCKDEAYELLVAVGLYEKADDFPRTLSGGQQQRVALARALFGKPTFLIADEPTGNLDIATGKQIVDLIAQFQKKYNMGIIISSHNSYLIEKMDVVYKVSDGIVESVVIDNNTENVSNFLTDYTKL